MIRSLWISQTGLNAQQTQMDLIANNLANVNTPSFKCSRAVFQDLSYETVRQPGAQSSQQTQSPSGLQLGTGVRLVATERIFTQGAQQNTGNDKDVYIHGDGFLQVLLPNGTMGYTRAGSLHIDDQGQLVTVDGYVIQPAITTPPGLEKIEVNHGIVNAKLTGVTELIQIGEFQIATFINNTGLESIGENLYLETTSSGPPNLNTPGTNGAGQIVQGAIEGSNVNVTVELVNMIATQRAYEFNGKAITASDQMLTKLSMM